MMDSFWFDYVEPAKAILDSIGFDLGTRRISLLLGIKIILVSAVLIVAARLTAKVARRIFSKLTKLDPTQQLLGEKLTSIAIYALAFFIGIDVLGIDLTALAVFSGAFGLAVGFGLQKTFGNLIAGIILLMDRSIKPGDVIAVSDTAGTSSFGQVKKIGIRAVSVITRDKREYLIPNENLMINQVENWSYSSRDVRIQVPIGVSYDCDISQAEALMREAATASPRVLDTPAPVVWLNAFGPDSIEFVIQIWINDPEEGLGNVRSDVLKRLWHLFRAHGLTIPYAQRDINLRQTPAFEKLVDALGATRHTTD